MKSRLALFVCLLAAASAYADRGGFRIKSFDVDLEVQPNADLVVTERIDVEFLEARHGIYRTIPVDYTDPRGYLYSLGFRLMDVRDETGAPYEVRVTHPRRYVKIRIGDPNRTVRGRVVYALRYRVRDAIVHFAEHDELYWNVTGHEWQQTIEAASARILLPGPVEPDSLEAVAYTGRFGSVEQDAAIEVPEPSVVSYRAGHTLPPLTGMTVALAWPHGLVSFPTPAERTARFLADNWVVLFPFLALGFLFHRYWTLGRDPRGPISVMVRYEPPPDLTPGEIGALVDERVDVHDLTATVVDLAIRGYLRIRVDEKERLFGLWSSEETWFERTDRPEDDLRDYERKLLDGLFTSGNVVSTEDLEEKFYKRIPEIRDALWDGLVSRRYVVGSPPDVRLRFKIYGLVAGALTFAAGFAWALHRAAPMPQAIFLPVVAGTAVTLLFALFSRSMPRRTRKGVHFRTWAIGFEEFVDRVERENLEASAERNVFETLLPYAMALGVARAWARRFEGIYEAAPPAWFNGSTPSTSGFSTPRFERTLSTAMTRAGSGMITAPRSQGSSGFGGGGGFSGGGGGGGGGGSW